MPQAGGPGRGGAQGHEAWRTERSGKAWASRLSSLSFWASRKEKQQECTQVCTPLFTQAYFHPSLIQLPFQTPV